MKTIVEIRAAEGGADAKLLVEDMYNIYSEVMKVKKKHTNK